MRALLLLLLLAPLGTACVPGGGPGGGPRDDEGVVILDDGIPDAGPVVDAGTDAGDDAGFNFNLDGGLPFDAGLAEYEGTPEPGVVCGFEGNACDPGASCCLVGLGATCSPSGDSVCPDQSSNLACDGPEDCFDPAQDAGPPLACCLGGDIATGLTTQCRAFSDCVVDQQPPVCTSTAECPQGLTCCGLVGGLLLPVDLGVCTPVCAGGI